MNTAIELTQHRSSSCDSSCSPACYPWQTQVWQHIWCSRKNSLLAHAYMISGPEHSGLLDFANKLAQSLLCVKANAAGEACGVCQNCRRCQAASHPDRFFLQADGNSQSIKVDQVRDLLRRLTQTTIAGDYRLAIIDSLEALTPASSNSLLKHLEEPAPYTIFLLLSTRPQSVSATLASRCHKLNWYDRASQLAAKKWLCQRLSIAAADAEQLLDLALAGPLLAEQLAADGFLAKRQQFIIDLSQLRQRTMAVSACVSFYEKAYAKELPWLLQVWSQIVHQLLKVVSADVVSADKDLSSASFALSSIVALEETMASISVLSLLDFASSLQQAIVYLKQPIQGALLLEDLFLRWQQLK